MKRFINPKSIPLLVLLSSLLAVLLRIWTRGTGPDVTSGLFPRQPLAWGLLWLLTVVTVAAVFYALLRRKSNGTYQDYYPKSVPAALCTIPAAISFLVSGYQQLRDSVGLMLPETTVVDTVAGIFGLAAGLCLLLGAVHRAMGRKPFFLINGVVCLYLAVRLFNRCQIWSNEPQMGIVIFPLLASTALMVSSYHRVCFDVDLGNRRWAALWSLMSVYLCAVALFSFEQPLFYGLCVLWQMADLCSLRPLKRKPKSEDPECLPEQPEAEA